MRNKKGQLVWDEFIPWTIGIGVLVFGFALYFILSGKGAGLINYLKNIFVICFIDICYFV